MSRENDEQTQRVLNILQGQLDRNEQIITSILSGYDRLFGLTILVFAGALSIGFEEERREVLLVLPAAILGIFLAGFGALIELAARQGYSRYLEERINSESNTSDLMWARHIASEVVAHAWTNRYLLPTLYVFFVLVSCYLSVQSAFSVDRLRPWRGVTIVLTVASVTCVVIAATEATRAAKRSHRIAQDCATGPQEI